jgi:hypothetical protein
MEQGTRCRRKRKGECKQMKIITSKWVTNMTLGTNGCIGFVLIQSDDGINKLYVGNGKGIDEKEDEIYISEWGTEITEESDIYKLLYASARRTQEGTNLIVKSGYGGNTDKPFVEVESYRLDHPLQLSPADARGFALNLFEAADYAESEAFLMNFFKTMGLSLSDSANILGEFRKYRTEHREDPPPSTPAESL